MTHGPTPIIHNTSITIGRAPTLSIAQHAAVRPAVEEQSAAAWDKIRTLHRLLQIAIIAPHLELLLRRYLICGDKKAELGCWLTIMKGREPGAAWARREKLK